jgi:mycofactocin glycosyltransferase
VNYTIAIPLRDGAATIGHVVRASLAQFPAPIRVLVCDDGSRDTGARLAAAEGAAVLSHLAPRGLAAARNTLLAACNTEAIVFFDADAVPRPGCAAALLAGFSDPAVAAVGGRGAEAAYATLADRWRAAHTPQSHGDAPLEDDWMVMGLCCAFRVSALREVGGFDDTYRACGEDVDVSLRLRAAARRLVYRPEAVVDHARSDGAFGLLRQAWNHSRATARALAAHNRPVGELAAEARRAVWPAMTDAVRRLDAPDLALGAANLAVRLVALRLPPRAR